MKACASCGLRWAPRHSAATLRGETTACLPLFVRSTCACNDAFRSVHSSNDPTRGRRRAANWRIPICEQQAVGGPESPPPVARRRVLGEYLAVSGPALQEMLSGAGQLAPRLAARAREADELRGLPDESVSEIDRLGMLGAATPITLGGREEGPEAIFEAPFALAKRFAPTAWCGGNGAIHNLQSSAFRGEAQEKYVGKGVCHECRPDPARLEPRRLGPTHRPVGPCQWRRSCRMDRLGCLG